MDEVPGSIPGQRLDGANILFFCLFNDWGAWESIREKLRSIVRISNGWMNAAPCIQFYDLVHITLRDPVNELLKSRV
jgi:hypothetical protein